MAYEIADVSTLKNGKAAWDSVVEATPEAWLWTTSSMHKFRTCVLEKTGRLVGDHSFVVLDKGTPCGLAPLVLSCEAAGGMVVAAYGDVALPWPLVAGHIAERAAVENILLDEIERRVRASGGGMLSLMLAPPGLGSNVAAAFNEVVRKRSFVDSSFSSHWIDVSPATLTEVRERYRRYVKKFWDQYELVIFDSQNISDTLPREYMDIHVKDAGGVFRPLETYERQVELARRGEGFWVGAVNKSVNKIVGMLMVSVHKQAAYDFSVAIDPDYQGDRVSNLLKWKAIQHLIEMGITHYELGQAAITPSYLWQPSSKNYGISFFKDGWSRGRLKTVWVADKYFDSACLRTMWERKLRALESHFQITEP
jgi:ribosomal protein S18 acetylase RimI-like enzyme